MSGCIFCEIASGTGPRSVVFEDEVCLAFMDLYPITRGHLLVIPRQHFETLEACPSAIAGALINVVQRMNVAVRAALNCEGVLNEVMNGEAAGQEIFHLHVHVIPRWAQDGFGWTYPPGYHARPASRGELDDTAARVRRVL